MNKNNKFIFIFYLYIHTSLFFYFFTFYFSIFLFLFLFLFLFFWAQAYMGWARPSQPSPVTGQSQGPGWAKSCTREVTSHVLHCAKVIKLPSHSVYKHNMQGMKGERKERTCFGRRRCLQRWWILAYCFPLSSFCVHLSACSFCFLSSFWNREDDEEAALLGICFDSGFSLFAGTKAMAGPILVSVYCCSLVLSVSLCIISFSGFMLCFSSVLFSGFWFFVWV